MSIKFSACERINPVDRNAPRKFYPIAKSSDIMNLKQISNRIASMCTVNTADVLAVLNGMVQVMKEEVANGKIMKLDDFGSFQTYISGTGSATAEEVTSASVLSARLSFKPGEDLKNMLLTLKYVKVAPTPEA